jgi:tetratricopeptide (TPR) repeat protein
MAHDGSDSPLARLVPAVAEFATEQFHLKEDLDRLDKVQRVGAPEAVILYCARILEALAAAALRAVKLEQSPNVFSNLETLWQYRLIPTTTCHWAHALRRTANLVRHIRCRVRPDDAELAVLFAERWLEWFFRAFRYGLCLPSLTRDEQPLGLSGGVSLRPLLEALENLDQNLTAMLQQVRQGFGGDWLRAPAIPGVLAEMLLDRGNHEEARAVLDAASGRFRDDLRLRQLLGLYWSRTDRLEEALRCVDPLYEQYKDDDETVGITAGVYKRLWLQDRKRFIWLEKSRRAYCLGWELSKRGNAYLGINAATTALWLGRLAESRRLAEEVGQLLHARATVLAEHASSPDLVLNYWDQVTLAEAELLRGELATARCLYRDAFAKHSEHQRANMEVSYQQLGEILRALGLSYSVATFLERPLVSDDRTPLLVGVAGGRRLPSNGALRQRVLEALDFLRRRGCQGRERRLVVLSTLAEGADRLVTDLVLSAAVNGRLHVLLPCELGDYRTDFDSGGPQREFQMLLDQADVIHFPQQRQPSRLKRGQRSPTALSGESSAPLGRDAAYARAGRSVVDRCDVLLALWDDRQAQEQCGAEEVVAYARQVGQPLVWIRTTPPFEVAQERMEQL